MKGDGPRLTDDEWRKSSFSAQENCVDVCRDLRHLRDRKNPTGPTLRVDVRSFIAALGEVERKH